MTRAFSITEMLTMRKNIIPFTGPWADAFGNPERTGVWFIWGNTGNGKSSFVMQLCKELCKHGTVLYDSMEESISLTMVNTLKRFNMLEENRRLKILDCEPIEELSKRLNKRKSADFIIIDSFQYTLMGYKQYLKFKEAHRNKMIIFISQADGKQPSGRTAKSVLYDASQKIWVEGFHAISNGRYIGPTGKFIIWEEGAVKYWGDNKN